MSARVRTVAPPVNGELLRLGSVLVNDASYNCTPLPSRHLLMIPLESMDPRTFTGTLTCQLWTLMATYLPLMASYLPLTCHLWPLMATYRPLTGHLPGSYQTVYDPNIYRLADVTVVHGIDEPTSMGFTPCKVCTIRFASLRPPEPLQLFRCRDNYVSTHTTLH